MSISTDKLKSRIADALGVSVTALRAMRGGDISAVYLATLDNRREVIVKLGGPCEIESRMLGAISKTGCRAPEVLHAEPDLLLMSRLAEGSGSDAAWADAGAQIALMHASLGDAYGWRDDTSFGAAPCPAATTENWPRFWAERRLLAWPEALPAELRPRLEALSARLHDLLPRNPAPSLLHGDLWRGNVLLSDDAFSGLIDPACYHGHAEVDLAMLCLFGQPPRSFWDAYGPLEAGWHARQPIYQLWPALVHLRLFGAGYRGMVDGLLMRIGV